MSNVPSSSALDSTPSTSASPGKKQEIASKGKALWLLSSASIAVAVTAADTYVVVLALEEMMAGVGLGISKFQRATPILSGFLLGYIAFLPLLGRLSDMISRRKVLLWSMMIFAIGSLITGVSVELDIMVLGRILQGIGGGGLLPATLALVADLRPPGQRAAALGMVGAVQEIGSVIGPVMGAAILIYWDWRMIFWINAVAAVILVIVMGIAGQGSLPKFSVAQLRARSQGQLNPLSPEVAAGSPADAPAAAGNTISALRAKYPWLRWVHFLGIFAAFLGLLVTGVALYAPEILTSSIDYGAPFVPYEGHSARLMTPIGLWGIGILGAAFLLTAPAWVSMLRQVDTIGALLIAISLGALILTFSSSDPEKEVVGPLGYKLLPLALIAALAYLWRHRKAADPLIAHGVVRGRVLSALVISVFIGAGLVAIVVNIPVLARLTITSDQTVAALVLVRFLLAVPVGAFIGGRLASKFGASLLCGSGLVLAAGATASMLTWDLNALNSFSSWAGLIIAGLGIGLTIAPVNDVVLADAPEEFHGTVAALVVVARMMGMVVGLALLTSIGLYRLSQYLQHVVATSPTHDYSKVHVTAAGVVQVHTIFIGAMVCFMIAALLSFTWFARKPGEKIT